MRLSDSIIVTQLGFLPDGEKRAYLPFVPDTEEFSVLALDTRYLGRDADGKKRTGCPTVFRGTAAAIENDPLGVRRVLDFSAVSTPGLYQLIAGGMRSHPFFIRKDLYIRGAAETFEYSWIQRCGCEVPGWHAACHTDDAAAPDGHHDLSGGWHDAGDLRKWVDHTFWQATGILTARNAWGPVFSRRSPDDMTAELLHGNRYFLAMQDTETGFVRHDVGGEEADNSWTDNVAGSEDDRRLSDRIVPHLQYKFAWIESELSMLAEAVPEICGPAYGKRCRLAAEKAFAAAEDAFPAEGGSTLGAGFALLAAASLYRSTSEERYRLRAGELARLLLSLQERRQRSGLSGFFRENTDRETIFEEWWQTAIPPLALIESAGVVGDRLGKELTEAFRRYLDRFILPLSEKSAYGLIPVRLCAGDPTHDRYRSLEPEKIAAAGAGGGLQFRFFLPCMSERKSGESFNGYGQGTNTFIVGQAYLLLRAWRMFAGEKYRRAALRQLEWVHGANPFGACLVTGRGTVTPYPHSRYLGLIPGAIMNGITGDREDAPHLGCGEYDLEWQTLEYWSPQQAQYLMCLSALHPRFSLETDIGVRIS